MASHKRSRHGCLWFILIAITLIALFIATHALGLLSLLPWGSAEQSVAAYGDDEFPRFEETWSYGRGSNKVIRVGLKGMIMLNESGGLFSSRGSALLALQAIRRATLDDTVQGLILDIDSGGGGITASDIILNALLEFKRADPNRRVVAICGDVAASGAYYIALGADHIIARPTTVTGSIGVIMQGLNLYGLGEKIGVKDVTIKSGENKDLLNPFLPPNPEHAAVLQSVINEMHSRFVALVAEHRGIGEEQVRALADGRIMTAQAAMDARLIDEIGYWDDAMNRLAELLGVDDIIVYRYNEAFTLRSLLMASTHKRIVGQALSELTAIGQTPPLQYRWRP